MKEKMYLCGETLGEILLGVTIGITASNVVLPKIETKTEKTIVSLGIIVGSWMLGRTWAKIYTKWFDQVFDTNHGDPDKYL